MVPSDIPRRPRIRPATPPFGRNSNSSRSGSTPGDDDDTSELLLDSSSKGYNVFLTAFNAMVGLDPELRQNVLFVYEETERLGRRLLREEYPDRLREAFMLPSSMPLNKISEVMNLVVIEVQNQQRNWDEMYSLLDVYRKREGHCNIPNSHVEGGA